MEGSIRKKRAPGYQKERGDRQQVRILALLESGPKSSYELSDALHLCRNRVHCHLMRLMDKKDRRVFISGYQFNHGRPKHLYSLGSARNVSVLKFQCSRLMAMMIDNTKAISAYDMAEQMDMGYGSIKIYLKALKRLKKVYIADWVWSHKTPMALYLMGNEDDVPKPTEMPKKKLQKQQKPQVSIFASLGL